MLTDTQAEFQLYSKFEATHWWFVGRRKILSVFLKLIGRREQKRLLEVGCGTGGNLTNLFGEFQSVTGLEMDENAYQFAREKLPERIRLLKGNANDLPKSDKYDVIAYLDVLCHAGIPDVTAALKQAYAALNPGAIF